MEPLLHSVTARQIDWILKEPTGGYIFHGPTSMGKAASAHRLAKKLNCQGDDMGLCGPCRQLDRGTFADLVLIGPDEGKSSISIDRVRELGKTLSLSPYYENSMRVVIIEDAQMLTTEAQNALLKLIEEPPLRTLFLVVTDALDGLLPTVCSRLSGVYFAPVSKEAIVDMLMERTGVGIAEAQRFADLSDGVPGLALMLATDESRAEELASLDEAAGIMASASVFDRLKLAKRLVDKKINLPALVQRVHCLALKEFEADETTDDIAASRMAALEQCREGLAANVGARVALERLMLEL